MTESKLFISNRSQAVRLPKAVAFPDGVKQVEISKLAAAALSCRKASAGTISSVTARARPRIS